MTIEIYYTDETILYYMYMKLLYNLLKLYETIENYMKYIEII